MGRILGIEWSNPVNIFCCYVFLHQPQLYHTYGWKHWNSIKCPPPWYQSKSQYNTHGDHRDKSLCCPWAFFFPGTSLLHSYTLKQYLQDVDSTYEVNMPKPNKHLLGAADDSVNFITIFFQAYRHSPGTTPHSYSPKNSSLASIIWTIHHRCFK